MKRTYEVHFTVKGVTTVSFDDSDYDTVAYECIAEDIFYDLLNERVLRDIDLDTVEITDTKRTDDD